MTCIDVLFADKDEARTVLQHCSGLVNRGACRWTDGGECITSYANAVGSNVVFKRTLKTELFRKVFDD